LEGSDLNAAKSVLAFEATALAHGKEEAVKAYEAASGMFGSRQIPAKILPSSTIPRGEMQDGEVSVPMSLIDRAVLQEGIPAFKLFLMAGLVGSGGEARRLIAQGGAYINGDRVTSPDNMVKDTDIPESEILLRAGKKRYHKLKFSA